MLAPLQDARVEVCRTAPTPAKNMGSSRIITLTTKRMLKDTVTKAGWMYETIKRICAGAQLMEHRSMQRESEELRCNCISVLDRVK